jgi:hypothetical protein
MLDSLATLAAIPLENGTFAAARSTHDSRPLFLPSPTGYAFQTDLRMVSLAFLNLAGRHRQTLVCTMTHRWSCHITHLSSL